MTTKVVDRTARPNPSSWVRHVRPAALVALSVAFVAAFTVAASAAAAPVVSRAIGFVGSIRMAWEDRSPRHRRLHLFKGDPIFLDSLPVPAASSIRTAAIRVDLLSGRKLSLNCRKAACNKPLELDFGAEQGDFGTRLWDALQLFWSERGQPVNALSPG